MIKSVTVINHLGDSLTMELKRPETSGFYIRKIDGLGPVKATVNVIERAIMDGASYNSARVGSRNIAMYLGFVSTGNVEDIRHKSYKYFPLKKMVTIRIETDSRICETYGYVDTNDPDIFSNGETTLISIICPDSYFYEVGSSSMNMVSFGTVEPEFTFEFSNEITNHDHLNGIRKPTLVLGEMIEYPNKTVFYTGDIEVGVNINIHAFESVSKITIANQSTGEKMVINANKLKTILNTNYGIRAGDDIVISTSKGEKSIVLRRGDRVYNIINCLERYPDWFQLTPGNNIFMCEAKDDDLDGVRNLQFQMTYKTAYEGV